MSGANLSRWYGEAGRDVTVHLHLLKPDLPLHEPQREAGVGRAGGMDVGDSVAVAQDIDRAGQPGEPDFPLDLGKPLAQLDVCTAREQREHPEGPAQQAQEQLHGARIRCEGVNRRMRRCVKSAITTWLL